MTIEQAFNESAEYYDSWVKKAIPCWKDVFAISQELIPYDLSAPIDVLDLGAGTGLFSNFVLAQYPRAKFILYDVSEQMLAIARSRFHQADKQFQFIVGDYRDIQDLGSFDLIISSLSIHHLEDHEKKTLFERIYTLLRDQGVFINVDQIEAPMLTLRELYWTNWLQKVRQSGALEEQIQASIRRRTQYDKDAPLSAQLQWLQKAGFTDVDCVYKNYFIGVFYARKHFP